MEYQVKTIASKDEIESGQRFEIGNFIVDMPAAAQSVGMDGIS